MAIEVTRWWLEKVDRTNGKNVSKFYKIYVFYDPFLNRFAEIRHWGRIGTEGRWERTEHDTNAAAMDTGATKAYAERGKGYGLISEMSFLAEPTSHVVITPKILDKAAEEDLRRRAEMGLGQSPLDRFSHEAQTLLAQLQDPKSGLDLARVHKMKMEWDEINQQFERASATMKMVDLMAGQRVMSEAQKKPEFVAVPAGRDRFA